MLVWQPANHIPGTPFSIICLVHTSSFLSRNVSLWNLPDPPRQRDHLFFLVLAVLWTVLYFYTCCFVYIYIIVIVQLLSYVRLFATHGLQHIGLPCPSPSPGVCPCPLRPMTQCPLSPMDKLLPIKSIMSSNHLILSPPSLPALNLS